MSILKNLKEKEEIRAFSIEMYPSDHEKLKNIVNMYYESYGKTVGTEEVMRSLINAAEAEMNVLIKKQKRKPSEAKIKTKKTTTAVETSTQVQ